MKWHNESFFYPKFTSTRKGSWYRAVMVDFQTVQIVNRRQTNQMPVFLHAETMASPRNGLICKQFVSVMCSSSCDQTYSGNSSNCCLYKEITMIVSEAFLWHKSLPPVSHMRRNELLIPNWGPSIDVMNSFVFVLSDAMVLLEQIWWSLPMEMKHPIEGAGNHGGIAYSNFNMLAKLIDIYHSAHKKTPIFIFYRCIHEALHIIHQLQVSYIM